MPTTTLLTYPQNTTSKQVTIHITQIHPTNTHSMQTTSNIKPKQTLPKITKTIIATKQIISNKTINKQRKPNKTTKYHKYQTHPSSELNQT